MSLMHGTMESAIWFMIPYLKVYYDNVMYNASK